MKTLVAAASALVVVLAAEPAFAQRPPARPERPYRGLFGGGIGETEQLLTVNFSLGAGYDDNVLAGHSGPGAEDPRNASAGGFGNATADLSYSLTRSRVGLNASFGTSAFYYPDAPKGTMAAFGGAIGSTLQVAADTRLTASHSTSYQPYLTLSPFPTLFDTPGQTAILPPGLGITEEDFYSHLSSVELTHGLGRRKTLSFEYGFRQDQYGDAERNQKGHSGSGRFVWGLARGLDARVGYGYTGASYRSQEEHRLQGHNLDIGVDFNRALSFSRRTQLSFGTGTSALVDHDRTVYRLTGDATLTREIGRTWHAALSYSRGLGFLETLREPVFTDAVTLGTSGMLSRRLELYANGKAAIGQFALSGGSGFDTYTATTGLAVGLTRQLGVGVSYTYYRYAFDVDAPRPEGVPRQVSRNSVQANLNVWVPLIHRARRPDASR